MKEPKQLNVVFMDSKLVMVWIFTHIYNIYNEEDYNY